MEVARRVLAEADRGVPFDEMAILLRAPHTYLGLLEHALARAGIPAWFERGTRRPDPAGRAFLALLACADEQLSARRFAEYLSLGQVPSAALHSQAPEGTAGRARRPWSPPTDDLASGLVRDDDRAEDPGPRRRRPATERDGNRIVAGTLRAPWRWEELLVEAYVIQGLDRWRAAPPGTAPTSTTCASRELRDEDEDSPRVAAILRDREELTHLEDFALPMVGDAGSMAHGHGRGVSGCGVRGPRPARAAPAGPRPAGADGDGAARGHRPRDAERGLATCSRRGCSR